MKIKRDFVTNSSSTSFIFVFKGNQRTDLFRQMVKHEEHFNLFNEYGPGVDHIDVWDIIKAIDPILSSNKEDPYYLPKPSPTLKHIENLVEEVRQYEKELIIELKREKGEDQTIWKASQYTTEHIKECKEKIVKYEKFAERGLDSLVEISFGDNDGIIQGGAIGMTMDYSGRDIKIDDDTFAVVIENCH
jgi:hypothetical protein